MHLRDQQKSTFRISSRTGSSFLVFHRGWLRIEARLFSGREWDSLCNLYDIGTVCAARDAHLSVGIVEKQVHLLKMGYAALDRANVDNLSRQELLALAVTARNTTALSGCSWTPTAVITGRDDDFSSRLMNIPSISSTSSSVHLSLHTLHSHLSEILRLRADFAFWDSDNTIALALSRPLRSGAKNTFQPLDAAHVWDARQKIWQNGLRLLCETGRSSIVERGSRINKVPTLWIRPRKMLIDQNAIADVSSDPGSTQPTASIPKASSSSSSQSLIPSAVPRDSSVSLSFMPTSSQLDSGSSQSLIPSAVPLDLSVSPSLMPSTSQLDSVASQSLIPQPPNQPAVDSAQRSQVLPYRRYNIRSMNRYATTVQDEIVGDCYCVGGIMASAVELLGDTDECHPLTFSLGAVTRKPQPDSMDSETASLFDTHGSFDLSKIPLRIAIKIDKARQALRGEVQGLLIPDKHGVSSARIVPMSDIQFSALEKLRCTVVTKIKAGDSYKSRLCLRGDMQSLVNAAFCSAPTANRDYIKIAISAFINHEDFCFRATDVSRDFAQADYLRKKG